ncbi:zinc finger protein 184-like [Sitodiplosis mosellana]|uniref:zinc finger protein 184-like n=1 Tax=Sitodiplosis mosellana TaxID=263140 RepID=UPI00244375FA|nr:zinc finger protein 184-like [Sitodiplosis mosellana]
MVAFKCATLEEIASEMQSQEISLDKEFNDRFLSATIDQVKGSFNAFMSNRRDRLMGQISVATDESIFVPMKLIVKACDSTVTESLGITKPNETLVPAVEHGYLDNFKGESSKRPAKKQKRFVKANPVCYSSSPSCFGMEHKCPICFKQFVTMLALWVHQQETQHYLNMVQNTCEHLRPLKLFELSPSDDELMLRPRKLPPGSMRVKPIKCKFCPREFTQKTFLKKHEEKHQAQNDTQLITTTKGRPTCFKCTVCSKQFSKKLLFVQHQQTHVKAEFSSRK